VAWDFSVSFCYHYILISRQKILYIVEKKTSIANQIFLFLLHLFCGSKDEKRGKNSPLQSQLIPGKGMLTSGQYSNTTFFQLKTGVSRHEGSQPKVPAGLLG